jgi:Protein of unknown function (DUF3043)
VKLRLPGRRPESDAEAAVHTGATAYVPTAAGKGRPTPKRSEAQGRRQGPPPPPPTTRKEAYRRQREQGASRGAARGVVGGGERALPARDQGPRRQLVRDIVDSRRNVGSVFLLVAVLLVGSYAIPNGSLRGYASLVWFFFFLLIVADSIVLARKIRKTVAERFPDHPEKMRSLVWYGINRTTLPRRWRFPKAQVSAGAEV